MFLAHIAKFSTLPSNVLRDKIKSGLLRKDAFQDAAIKPFDALFTNFTKYNSSKFLRKTPKSLYIYGGVGRGKTMMMEIFYSCCQTNFKRYAYLNEFLADVHVRIRNTPRKSEYSIQATAADLSKNARLFCLDEFQVTDIADAILLKSLFEKLWTNCVIVMTSNSAPDDLYRNGLNRERFLPFIDLLKTKAEIVNLDSAIDYRLTGNHLTYYFVIDSQTDEKLNQLFEDLAKAENCQHGMKSISMPGREIKFEKSCGRILDTCFKDLCDRNLGFADYTKIGETFHTVFVRNVPKFSVKLSDQSQRFIRLVDIFYLKRVRLVVSAEATPEKLFSAGKSIGWERAVSRLNEMGTEKYWSESLK